MKLTQAIKRAKEEGRVPLIAEVKLRSPKDGELLQGRNPVQIASEYIRGGACAISVVTEPLHFGGSLEVLRKIAAGVNVPVLRKDFIKKKQQILETRRSGAGAVLLISAMLPGEKLNDLNEYAHSLDMETVVEIHTSRELQDLEGLSLDMVGINNKDILDLERGIDQTAPTEELARHLPPHVIIISESGIRNREDVRKVIASGADAVLVGTALMLSKKTALTVATFIHALEEAND